jgi:uncharacterized protein (TIGR02246 family)
MKRLAAIALSTLLIGATAAPVLAAEVTEAELMRAATELARQYDADYDAKNPAAMAALYTPDGVMVSPSGPIVRGREALASYYASRFASGAGGHAIKVVEVHVQGDGGYGIAQFSVSLPRANGDLHQVHGGIVAVYQHGADGWHIRLLEASLPATGGK